MGLTTSCTCTVTDPSTLLPPGHLQDYHLKLYNLFIYIFTLIYLTRLKQIYAFGRRHRFASSNDNSFSCAFSSSTYHQSRQNNSHSNTASNLVLPQRTYTPMAHNSAKPVTLLNPRLRNNVPTNPNQNRHSLLRTLDEHFTHLQGLSQCQCR